jgi:hypothetical protein
MMLSTKNVGWSAGGAEILRDVSLDVQELLDRMGPVKRACFRCFPVCVAVALAK